VSKDGIGSRDQAFSLVSDEHKVINVDLQPVGGPPPGPSPSGRTNEVILVVNVEPSVIERRDPRSNRSPLTRTVGLRYRDLVQAGNHAYHVEAPHYDDVDMNVGVHDARTAQEVPVTLQRSTTPQLGYNWTNNSLGMVLIALTNLAPHYRFWLSEAEVTVAAYDIVVGGAGQAGTDPATPMNCLVSNGRADRGDRSWRAPGFAQTGNDPVVGVSWRDATNFCALLTARERTQNGLKPNQAYRLPKDREWSYAAREGLYRFPWGNDVLAGAVNANYAGKEVLRGMWPKAYPTHNWEDRFARTAPVKSFRPNALGFYDLGGNVAEWCEDWYSTNLNPANVMRRLDSNNPLTQDGGGQMYRVLRGASWFDSADWELETATRQRAEPGTRDDRYGFRVVLVEE
jgi:formylglycine-generating enzyme required for sulfatase activity